MILIWAWVCLTPRLPPRYLISDKCESLYNDLSHFYRESIGHIILTLVIIVRIITFHHNVPSNISNTAQLKLFQYSNVCFLQNLYKKYLLNLQHATEIFNNDKNAKEWILHKNSISLFAKNKNPFILLLNVKTEERGRLCLNFISSTNF